MNKDDDIVVAALDQDECDVTIAGHEHPPVGASLALTCGENRTEWRIVAVRKQADSVILTCRRDYGASTGPNLE